jgi:hypothetical protein
MTTKDFVLIAKLAQDVERFDDMKNAMKKFVIEMFMNNNNSNKQELTIEERDLLIISYKQVVAKHRKSLRFIRAKFTNAHRNRFGKLIINYFEQIENELKSVINEFIQLLEKYLLPSTQKNLESKCLYLKLKSDFLRYLLDLETNNEFEKQILKTQTHLAFKSSFEFIKSNLDACNPIRLGLALSYSNYFYEILLMPEHACELAKEAFDSALMDMELVENNQKRADCKLFIQLLRDNLILWTQFFDESNK